MAFAYLRGGLLLLIGIFALAACGETEGQKPPAPDVVSVVDEEEPEPVYGATVVDERIDTKGNRIMNEYAATATVLELGVHPGRHLYVVRADGKETRFEMSLARR